MRIGMSRELEADETDEVMLEAEALLRFVVPEIETPEIVVSFAPHGVQKPTPGGDG